MTDDKDLQEEIRSIRRILNDYIETNIDNQSYRRAENIQILIALGILGGFITLYVQGEVQNSPFRIFFWLIAGSSSIFLLLKTLLPPLRLELQSNYLDIVDDRLMPFFYMFFVLLSVTVGIISLISMVQFQLSVPDLQNPYYVLGAVLSFISIVISYLYSRRYQQVAKERSKRREQILNEIGSMTENDLLHEIYRNPHLLGEDIDEMYSEYTISSGSAIIDLLAIDSSGDPILIEVKGRQARLEDVQQLLDYIDDFRTTNKLDVTPRGILVTPIADEKLKEMIEKSDHLKLVEIDPLEFSKKNSHRDP